jgi:hypothetical protein
VFPPAYKYYALYMTDGQFVTHKCAVHEQEVRGTSKKAGENTLSINSLKCDEFDALFSCWLEEASFEKFKASRSVEIGILTLLNEIGRNEMN